jgi:uncharacterized ferredoxin-like protein
VGATKNMIANGQVPLQQISEITNRKLSFARFLARNVDIEIIDEKVSIESAIKLTKMLCIKTADTEEIH